MDRDILIIVLLLYGSSVSHWVYVASQGNQLRLAAMALPRKALALQMWLSLPSAFVLAIWYGVYASELKNSALQGILWGIAGFVAFHACSYALVRLVRYAGNLNLQVTLSIAAMIAAYSLLTFRTMT